MQFLRRLPPVLLCFSLLSNIQTISTFHARILFLTELHAGDGILHPPVYAKMIQCGILAAHHINSRDASLVDQKSVDSLPTNFTVSLHIEDTWGTPNIAARLTSIHVQEGVHGIVGPQRSSESGPVSLIAGLFSVPTVSFWAISEKLADKNTYPHVRQPIHVFQLFSQRQLTRMPVLQFSRTQISAKAEARAILGVCQTLGWNRISVLFVDDLVPIPPRLVCVLQQ